MRYSVLNIIKITLKAFAKIINKPLFLLHLPTHYALGYETLWEIWHRTWLLEGCYA